MDARQIPEEVIKTAAKAVAAAQNVPFAGKRQESIARAALEAVGQMLAAQSIRAAADAIWDASPATVQGPDTARSWLLAYAAKAEARK